MRLLIVALAALLSVLLPQAAAAEERILRFDSNIAIGRDGTLDVTETIHVRVENVAINHGLYRDFPTKYRGPGGRRVKVGFELAGTWLDGQAEPSKVETMTNGVRIRIGSAGVMLPHYSALKVAEQFRVLEAIAPGRIDLGVGRAPGSDRLTAHALNPYSNAAEDFPQQVLDLQAWVTGSPLPANHPYAAISANPRGPSSPEIWILGSSDYGSQLAAHF